MQLNYWPCVIVTRIKYSQLATRLWVQVQLQPNIFFISVFNLGIANGAKVGLKLRLVLCYEKLGINYFFHTCYLPHEDKLNSTRTPTAMVEKVIGI